VEYLLAKAPGARAAWLPFEGANRVVYTPPRQPPAGEGAADERRWWDERSAGA
jgi:hypothetical protein